MAEQMVTVNPYALGLNQIGYATLVICIVFPIISILAVGLRIYTRRMLGNKLWMDDWLIMASVVFFAASCGDTLVGVYTYGGGQVYLDDVTALKKEVQYKKSQLALTLIYAVTVTPIKISILCFYHRIFAVASFRRVNYAVGIFCLVWLVVGIIADCLYCVPLRAYWDTSVDGHCYNFNTYFLAMEIIDLLQDVIIIALPLKTIATLQLSVQKKVGLLGVFLCGTFVVITGAIRISYVYIPHTSLVSVTQGSLWSAVNIGVAIVCACLPVFRPLISKVGGLVSGVRSRYGRTTGAEKSVWRRSEHSSYAVSKPVPPYYRINDSHADTLPLTLITADYRQGQSQLFGDIHVQSRVEVV